MKELARNICNIISTSTGSITIIMIMLFDWKYLEITKTTAWIWVISLATFIITGVISILYGIFKSKPTTR